VGFAFSLLAVCGILTTIVLAYTRDQSTALTKRIEGLERALNQNEG